MDPYDVAVIGGGPAGLFCAIHAAAPGRRVVIFEKNERPGKKLLLAGSGQCNLTHDGAIREFIPHYGDHGKFVQPSLLSFTNQDLRGFFRERGLETVAEENGKIFPTTRRSEDVLSILLAECGKRGVEIRCGEPVRDVSRDGDLFGIATGPGTYRSRMLVITTGGASYPSCGTTGDGYRLARSLGQPVTETAPALTPLIIREYPFAGLAGISITQASFTVWRDGKKAGSHTGDVLLTHAGISGPGILDASRGIRAGDTIRLSFLPGMTRETFAAELARRVAANPVRQVGTILGTFPMPERLAKRLLQLAGIPENLTGAHFPAAQRNALAGACTEFPLVVESLGDYPVAMATRGGVALGDVNQKTMESKVVPGLYFAGEVLDIDGDTGGYNLQAAFSTGHAAAMAIHKKLTN